MKNTFVYIEGELFNMGDNIIQEDLCIKELDDFNCIMTDDVYKLINPTVEFIREYEGNIENKIKEVLDKYVSEKPIIRANDSRIKIINDEICNIIADGANNVKQLLFELDDYANQAQSEGNEAILKQIIELIMSCYEKLGKKFEIEIYKEKKKIKYPADRKSSLVNSKWKKIYLNLNSVKIKKVNSNLLEVAAELDEIKDNLTKLKRQRTNVEKKIKKNKQEFNIDAAKKKIEELENKRNQLIDKKTLCLEELKLIKQNKRTYKEQQKNEQISLEQRLKELIDEKNSINNRIDETNRNIAEANFEQLDYEKKSKELMLEIELLSKKIQSSFIFKNKKQKSLKGLQEELGNITEIINSKNENISMNKCKLKSMNSELENIKKCEEQCIYDLEIFKNKISTAIDEQKLLEEKTSKNLNSYKNKIDALNIKIKNYKNEVKEREQEDENLNKKHKKIENEIITLEKSKEEFAEQVKKYQKEIAALSV